MRLSTLLAALVALLVVLLCACHRPPAEPGTQSDSAAQTAGAQTEPSEQLSTAQPHYEERPGSTPSPEEVAIVTVQGGLPEGWPADVPVMEGFEVVVSRRDTHGMMQVLSRGEASLDDVFSFYSALSGWTKDPNVPWVTDAPNHRMLKLLRGNENLSINVVSNAGRTELTLVYWRT